MLARHGLAVALVTAETGKLELLGSDTEAERLLARLREYGLVAESDGGYRTLLA